MPGTLRSRRGFTLVEIMIVVAIIGIIIAIAVPAFLRARENSRGTACQENLSKIDGAKESYAMEFRLANGAACDFPQLINPNGAATGEGYLKAQPQCPSGGAYFVASIGAPPQCTIGGNGNFTDHVVVGGAGGPAGPEVGGAPGGPPGGGP